MLLGSIALLALVLVVGIFVILRKRRARDPVRHLNDVGPVSGQWLADRRRSG
jgi:hypothetical protein